MIELESAVKSGCNIILLVKDGSRWPDDSGANICDFPPYRSVTKGCLTCQEHVMPTQLISWITCDD